MEKEFTVVLDLYIGLIIHSSSNLYKRININKIHILKISKLGSC